MSSAEASLKRDDKQPDPGTGHDDAANAVNIAWLNGTGFELNDVRHSN
jgi:hypothetical protein